MKRKFILAPDYHKSVFELDASSIPPCQTNTLADAILRGAKAFYATPGVEKQFQEWLRKRENQTTSAVARTK